MYLHCNIDDRNYYCAVLIKYTYVSGKWSNKKTHCFISKTCILSLKKQCMQPTKRIVVAVFFLINCRQLSYKSHKRRRVINQEFHFYHIKFNIGLRKNLFYNSQSFQSGKSYLHFHMEKEFYKNFICTRGHIFAHSSYSLLHKHT